MHVEQVLGDVPRTERCRCREEANEANEAKKTARGPSVIDRLWPFSSR
jgi:GTP cyclohydrolase II